MHVRLLVARAAAFLVVAPASAETSNALVSCDHSDPAFLEPFAARTGSTANVHVCEGTDTGLAVIDQSRPGDCDVFLVDSTDVRRVAERRLSALLDPRDDPLEEAFSPVRLSEHDVADGAAHAVPEKFGYVRRRSRTANPAR